MARVGGWLGGRDTSGRTERFEQLVEGIWGLASVREVLNLNGNIKFLNLPHEFLFFPSCAAGPGRNLNFPLFTNELIESGLLAAAVVSYVAIGWEKISR